MKDFLELHIWETREMIKLARSPGLRAFLELCEGIMLWYYKNRGAIHDK